MKRKSELLRAVETALFFERLRQCWLDQKLRARLAANRAEAKKLEQVGML